MARLVSTPEPFAPASEPANRLARALVVGGASLGVVLLLAATVLWAHYGTTVFFEMITAGLAACF